MQASNTMLAQQNIDQSSSPTLTLPAQIRKRQNLSKADDNELQNARPPVTAAVNSKIYMRVLTSRQQKRTPTTSQTQTATNKSVASKKQLSIKWIDQVQENAPLAHDDSISQASWAEPAWKQESQRSYNSVLEFDDNDEYIMPNLDTIVVKKEHLAEAVKKKSFANLFADQPSTTTIPSAVYDHSSDGTIKVLEVRHVTEEDRQRLQSLWKIIADKSSPAAKQLIQKCQKSIKPVDLLHGYCARELLDPDYSILIPVSLANEEIQLEESKTESATTLSSSAVSTKATQTEPDESAAEDMLSRPLSPKVTQTEPDESAAEHKLARPLSPKVTQTEPDESAAEGMLPSTLDKVDSLTSLADICSINNIDEEKERKLITCNKIRVIYNLEQTDMEETYEEKKTARNTLADSKNIAHPGSALTPYTAVDVTLIYNPNQYACIDIEEEHLLGYHETILEMPAEIHSIPSKSCINSSDMQLPAKQVKTEKLEGSSSSLVQKKAVRAVDKPIQKHDDKQMPAEDKWTFVVCDATADDFDQHIRQFGPKQKSVEQLPADIDAKLLWQRFNEQLAQVIEKEIVEDIAEDYADEFVNKHKQQLRQNIELSAPSREIKGSRSRPAEKIQGQSKQSSKAEHQPSRHPIRAKVIEIREESDSEDDEDQSIIEGAAEYIEVIIAKPNRHQTSAGTHKSKQQKKP